MSMEDKILEAILLEADRLKIDASPEHMNQSKKEIRRTQDYTVNEDEEDNDEEVESDDSNQNNEDEDGNTDYTANVPGNEDQGSQDDTGDDNTEDNQEEEAPEEEPAEDEGTEDDAGDEEPQEDAGEDDTGSDDNADEGGDEAGEGDEGGTDYTDMDAGDVEGGDDEGGDDTGDDSSSDDTSTDDSGDGSTPETDEQVNERHLKVKQLSLMNQMTGLHTSINNYLTQINDIERTNIYVSSIISTVIDNFNKLKDVIYKYIIYYFDNMSYEYNLYTFNYFIEAMKVNIELLAKIKDANNYEAE